eukprot:PhF_6_TR1508/c0_g1_i1/m.2738
MWWDVLGSLKQQILYLKTSCRRVVCKTPTTARRSQPYVWTTGTNCIFATVTSSTILYPRVVAVKHVAASSTPIVTIAVLGSVMQMIVITNYRVRRCGISCATIVKGSPKIYVAMNTKRTNVKSWSGVQRIAVIRWKQCVACGKRTGNQYCAIPYVGSV